MPRRTFQSRSLVDDTVHGSQDKNQLSPNTGRASRTRSGWGRLHRSDNRSRRMGVQHENHVEIGPTGVHKNDQRENKQGSAASINLGQILFNAFESVGKSSAAGLEASRWAPTTTPSNTSAVDVTGPPTMKSQADAEMHSVDDTDAFMAAVRSRFSSGPRPAASGITTPSARPTAVKDIKEIGETISSCGDASNTAPTDTPADVKAAEGATSEQGELAAESSVSAHSNSKDTTIDQPIVEMPIGNPSPGLVGEGEDREHLITFSNWGTPASRDTPAAQVRKVILRNIPPHFGTPSKVQSMIFGGAIDTFSVSPTGTSAHVLFCDAVACKNYYDAHPNGLVIDQMGRRGVVFVDMGKEVDVVSSQLRTSMSIGATRVIRAVGVNMDLSMHALFSLVRDRNLKLEKIVDTCAAGEVRIVTFRFCSIDHAVRFRSTLLRHEDWEQCNIQYAADPCEAATAVHWD